MNEQMPRSPQQPEQTPPAHTERSVQTGALQPDEELAASYQAEFPTIFDAPQQPQKPPKKPRKKGSRQLRGIITAVAVCLVLVVAASGVCRVLYHKGLIAYIQDAVNASDDVSSVPSQAAEAKLLFDYSAYGSDPANSDALALDGISAIRVQNEKDAYDLHSHWEKEKQIDPQTAQEVEKDVLRWLITDVDGRDVEGVQFSTSTVGFIVSDLLRMRYDAVYAEDRDATIEQGGQTYWQECGLDDPRAVCTVTFGNGAALGVVVGDQTPTGNGYFVSLQATPGADPEAAGTPKEDKRIYRVGADAVTYFLKEASYYVNKDIIAPVEQDEDVVTPEGDTISDPYFLQGELSRFDELTITGPAFGKGYAFTMVENDVPGYDSIYLMTSPLVQNVDLDAMSTLLAPVADGLTTAGCVVMKATDADIAKYGLDEPACTVRYVVKGQETVLNIGAMCDNENGYYAVMVKGNPSIMQIAPTSIAFMNYSTADFASSTLYSCNIVQVKTMQVTLEDGTSATFTLEDGMDENDNQILTVTTQDGATVREDDFRTMYFNFLGLTSFTNVVDGKDAETPAVTITMTYDDFDKVDVIRLSPYTERRYFMSLNGMGSTVVLSTAVDSFVSSFTALID